jgi:hypothetical protein
MPIEAEYERLKGPAIAQTAQVRLYAPPSLRPFIAIESADRAAIVATFTALCAELATIAPAEEEPMMNVIAWHDLLPAGAATGPGAAVAEAGAADAAAADAAAVGQWRVLLLPRARHRPSFYHADGGDRILLSPGTVDLGGVCITPVQRDFERLSADHLRQMLTEVMLPPDKLDSLKQRLRQLLQ